MKLTPMKTVMIALFALSAPLATGGCAVVAATAAADYFIDDNDVCNGPNDIGLIDSDCRPNNTKKY